MLTCPSLRLGYRPIQRGPGASGPSYVLLSPKSLLIFADIPAVAVFVFQMVAKLPNDLDEACLLLSNVISSFDFCVFLSGVLPGCC